MDMHTQPPSQLTVDGIAINILSMDEAVSAIASAARGDDSFSVCTLNLDHVAQLRRRAGGGRGLRRRGGLRDRGGGEHQGGQHPGKLGPNGCKTSHHRSFH